MPQDPEATVPRPALPMRLTRLRVKNFRSIADIDIPLSPLTVLVGPNGSGKSNVVDALRFVRDVFARGLDQAVMDREGMGVIQRWGTEGIMIEVELCVEKSETERFIKNNDEYYIKIEELPAKNILYGFTLSKGERGATQVSRERLILSINEENIILEIEKVANQLFGKLGGVGFIHGTSESIKTLATPERGLLMPAGLFDEMGEFFNKFDDEYQYFTQEVDFFPWGDTEFNGFDKTMREELFYNFNPSDLRQPQQVLKEHPFDEKGRNLAAVLRRLSLNNNSDWSNLLFILRQTIIGFDTIEVEKVGGYLATKLIYQTDTTQPRTSYLGQESDGTIRMLGILAALYQDPAQPFLSIEEPEANIHPGALAILAGVLDEASLRSQVLVTTHSPDMLDHLPVESFLVVEKIGDTTHVGPLDASQLASVRKRLFTPGELLRMEGLQRQTTPDSAA